MTKEFYDSHSEAFFKQSKAVTLKQIKTYSGIVCESGTKISIERKVEKGFDINFIHNERIGIYSYPTLKTINNVTIDYVELVENK